MRPFSLLSFLGLTILAGISAHAGNDCPPLAMVASVDMQIGADGRIYVPATIDGVRKAMLIDTGGSFSEITQAAVDELKLRARRTNLQLIGIAGDTTREAARGTFALGNLHADNMDFMVMPDVHHFARDVSDAVGLLAPNLFREYDLDLDMGGRKLNLISQDHCDGKVIYWPAAAVAVIPMRVNPSGHILLPVDLEGHRLLATLDTGASRSVLNLGAAQSTFGLLLGSSETPAEGALPNGPKPIRTVSSPWGWRASPSPIRSSRWCTT